jgi:hypothetical protein
MLAQTAATASLFASGPGGAMLAVHIPAHPAAVFVDAVDAFLGGWKGRVALSAASLPFAVNAER